MFEAPIRGLAATLVAYLKQSPWALPTDAPIDRAFQRIDVISDAVSQRSQVILIRVNGRRGDDVETFCEQCGSRFIGGRITDSFDFGHGSPGLSWVRVLLARSDLRDYHARVAAACSLLASQGRRLRVSSVFARAGLPNGAYLRARRLGLVDVVRARLGELVVPDDDFPVPDPSDRWTDPIARQKVAERGRRAT